MEPPIYIVMIDDKHTDTEAFVFTTAEAAIERAKSVSEEIEDDEVPDGWLYCGSWDSGESSAWVVESHLDPS